MSSKFNYSIQTNLLVIVLVSDNNIGILLSQWNYHGPKNKNWTLSQSPLPIWVARASQSSLASVGGEPL